MKLGWIPPLAIVVSIWYFVVVPSLPSTPVGWHQAVNLPMDLNMLMLVIMIMGLIIVLIPTESEV